MKLFINLPHIKWFILFIVTILNVACKPATNHETNQNSLNPKQQINYANTLDIRDINPHLYLGEMAAQNMVFESLVVNTAEGVKPLLASSWHISDNGKTYTFTLRQDVTFSDGAKFNAQAVKLNFDAILSNYSRHAWLEMVKQIQEVKVIDEYTVQIELKNAYYPLLVELGLTRPFRFLSPNDFIHGETKNGVKGYHGTGPWILAEHQKNSVAKFVRNDNYWGDKTKSAAVYWKVMPDPQTILLALEKGDVDIVFETDSLVLVDTDTYQTFQHDSKYITKMSSPIASRALVLNTQRPILKDKNIRLALQYAINKQAIVDGIFNDTEVKADTLLAKTTPYCNVDITTYDYNINLAKQILEKSGWQKVSDSEYRQKNGQKLQITLNFINKNAIDKTLSQAIQADLKAIGVDLVLQGEEKQIYLDRQRAGDFDMQYIVSWGTPYDPQSYVSSFRVPAHADYHAQLGLPEKKQLDQWISTLLITPDDNLRQQLYKQVLTTLANEAVYIPLSYSRIKVVYNKQLNGVEFNPSQYEIPFEKMYF